MVRCAILLKKKARIGLRSKIKTANGLRNCFEMLKLKKKIFFSTTKRPFYNYLSGTRKDTHPYQSRYLFCYRQNSTLIHFLLVQILDWSFLIKIKTTMKVKFTGINYT